MTLLKVYKVQVFKVYKETWSFFVYKYIPDYAFPHYLKLIM